MRLRFWKMSGTGNDFILLAGLPRGFSGAALARRLCRRRAAIGADGILVLSLRGGRLRLDYWNADGSIAFCGNGSRCAALWAKTQGWVKGSRFVLDTIRGALAVHVTGKGRAEVSMPAPKDPRLGLKLKALGRAWTVHFVDTGTPHAVVFVPNVEKIDVKPLGRALRFHKAFGKPGANVDFVAVTNGTLSLRTYERGVEDETDSCGTGVMAAAFVACALGKTGPSTRVKVRGGAVLNVSLLEGALLEGPADIVFTGEVAL
ncbi:MAG: diaminopimelate epimerase [Elusimicrobia bacterium GWC2_65_9]|nr:MAG: diaminopimelate epimerase [Elusimicrobia bacterium GWA2_66_18]OGR73679.1 MAG: diaminopimelate epimerase [Elusimicrobia bacterium GWC2_65_9]